MRGGSVDPLATSGCHRTASLKEKIKCKCACNLASVKKVFVIECSLKFKGFKAFVLTKDLVGLHDTKNIKSHACEFLPRR